MGRTRLSLLWAVIFLSAKVLDTRGAVVDITNATTAEYDFIDDPLEKWLENFDTYTFMLDQDVEDKSSEAAQDGESTDGSDETTFEGELALAEEDYDQSSSAPIVISVKKFGSLLDPNVDYKVKVESLVAEEGSILITLENFENKTACGVGGFSLHPLEDGELDTPEGLQHLGGSTINATDGTRPPVVAFAVDTQAETPTTWTVGDDAGSEWTQHSKDLWWAMGRLTGGGLLSLVFTPPECGCLVMKGYYALPVGENLTLVVGPESYPSDLEKFFCVDPSISSIEENLIESETDAVTDESSHPIHERSDDSADGSRKGAKGKGRFNARRRTRLQKKKRKQEARQAIRQAGRRVTKKRVRAHLRLRRKGDRPGGPEEEGRQAKSAGGKWARKQARKMARKQQRKERKSWKGKKPWKKHRKHAKTLRKKHRANRRLNRHQNGTEAIDEEEYTDHVNTTTESPTEEDTLADLLLGDEAEEGDEDEESEGGDDAVDEDAPHTRRGRKARRKNARKAKKLKNKEKRKGSKFCCKQGIKYKKSELNANGTEARDESEIPCNDVNDVVITFALHEFGVDETHCLTRYETCCTKFTHDLWESVKAKKAARKAKRKQQRKAIRQQKRRQKRRHRGASTTVTSTTI